MHRRWRVIWLFALIWAAAVIFGALIFLSKASDGDIPGITTDFTFAETYARGMEKAGAYVERAAHVFWPEVLQASRPYVIVAVAVLVGGSIFLSNVVREPL